MRCLFMAFAAAMVVAGCSPSDPFTNELLTASIAPGTGRKSVGVISAIGDTFNVQKVGLTVFQNEHNPVPIDAWGVDELVVSKVDAQLSQRFDVRRISTPKGAFASLDKPKSILSSDYKDPGTEIRDVVHGIAATQKCDLYVVITKGGSQVGNTNQSVGGIGILYGGAGAIFSQVHLHALFDVRVYDGQTFAVLGHQRGSSGQTALFAVIRGPNREVDKSWWPAQAQSVARDAKIKDATLALVEQSMTATVAELLLKN